VAGAFPKFWFLLGHLKPGASMKEAEADLTVVAKATCDGVTRRTTKTLHGANRVV